MIRRFVYDAASECVVEVGAVRGTGLSPRDRYREVSGEYKHQFNREASPKAGEQLRTAVLERADRREFAVKKYGTESRWSD
jgi:hypothetical protein